MSPVMISADEMTARRLAASPHFDPRLATIAETVAAGGRLSHDDGMRLYETPDIWTVCALADLVRRRIHGTRAYYNINRHVNYSNICALSCRFCSFHRKKGQDDAYEMSLDDIRREARDAADAGATELHIVGGLHPWLEFSYYTDMLRAVRDETPQLHLKAFTAVEIVHLARISGRGGDGEAGIRSVLGDLIDAGLGSLPGGGAEVFDDRVHDQAFKGKIRADEWLDVHRIAHDLGLNSNATMLYGHIEQRSDRIHHMMLLREEQDRAQRAKSAAPQSSNPGEPRSVNPGEPGAVNPVDPQTPPTPGQFQAIVPLPFFPDDSALENLPAPTGLENLRTLAICRLMLDNFPHVKAFWIMQGLDEAGFMLQNGADDIDGTVMWYDITKLDGPTTHQEAGIWDLQRVIREAGFEPVERDTLYHPVTRTGG